MIEEATIADIILNAPTIGDALIQFFDYVVIGLIGEKYEPLNNAIHKLLFSGLSCVVFFRAIVCMMGKGSDSIKEIALCAAWLMIALVITEPNIYFHYIIESVSQFTVGIGMFFVGGSYDEGTTFMAIDNLFVRLFTLLGLVYDELDWKDILELLLLGLLALVFIVLYAMFTIIVVFSKFALSVLFLMGGIVIQLAAFKAFRGTIKSWAQAIAKYALCIVIASIIIVICSQLCLVVFDFFLEEVAKGCADGATCNINDDTDIDPSDMFGSYYWLLGLSAAVAVFLMMKVIELTSEITGGVATDMSSSFNASVNAASLAAKAATSPLTIPGRFGAGWQAKPLLMQHSEK